MIQLTDEEKEKKIQEWKNYSKLAGRYMEAPLTRAVRMYKIYMAMADKVAEAEEDEDQPNIFLAYAFGLVEHMVSKVSESIFSMKPPVAIKSKRKADEGRARHLRSYARNIYDDPEDQLGYTRSVRERVICGWSWSRLEWANVMYAGKKWANRSQKVQDIIALPSKRGPINVPIEYDKSAWVQEPYQYPIESGVKRRFPSIFDVFPEPKKRNGKWQWLIEQERDVSIEELKSFFYEDPQSGRTTSLYQLEELLKAVDGSPEGSVIATKPDKIFGFDLGEEIETHVTENFRNDYRGGSNKVHLSHVRKMNEYYCIASCSAGDFIIAQVKQPFHRPRIPLFLHTCIQDNLSEFGIGIIRPNEHALYMLNDIQNLSMREFIQSVNQLLLIDESAIVTWDDFQPRSGGKVRVSAGRKPSEVAMPITNARDIISPMLAHQSNIKGFIEWTSAAADMSPGTEGTKQTHKTLGGLIQIQKNLDNRIGTLRRESLTVFQQEERFIIELLDQYLFSKISLSVFSDDGSFEYKDLGREDFVSEIGFDLPIDHDPTYGDDVMKMERAAMYFDRAVLYEDARLKFGRLDLPQVDLGEIFRQFTLASGWYDTSQVLKLPNDQKTPEQKFALMAQGVPIQPNPNEDLVKHLIELMEMRRSPEILKMLENKTIAKETLIMLDAHIEALRLMITQALQNPQEFGMALKQIEAQKNPQAGPQLNGAVS